MEIIELIIFALAFLTFGIPILYYLYAKHKWLPMSWNIKVDLNYKPKVTVILPTYNEVDMIEARLDNMAEQDYPKKELEVIVIDSNSNDGTMDSITKWASNHSEVISKLITEKERKGKLHAMNSAMKHVNPASELIILTDADAYWDNTTLSKIVRYFADPKVGAVTGSITYTSNASWSIENEYRSYYNILRVAESKLQSTPVHNGPLLAIRWGIVREHGLPNFHGSDDSAFGSYVAFMGYRAIQVDDVIVHEPIRGNQILRKVRRGQHALLSFWNTKRYAKMRRTYVKSTFDKIWNIEWWIWVINPWLFIACVVLSIISAFQGSIMIQICLVMALMLFSVKIFRSWVLQQLYLIMAAIRNLWTKDIMWDR